MSELNKKPFVVLKFGGTSVSKKDYWLTIANQVRETIAEGFCPIVVCSALTGISDRLHLLVNEAVLNGSYEDVLQSLKDRHREFAKELDVDFGLLQNDFDYLTRLIHGVALTHEVTPMIQAQVMSFGELLSTRLGAAFLAQQGLNSVWQDVRSWLQTVENPNSSESQNILAAVCDYQYQAELVELIDSLEAEVIVTQGFIAQNPQGRTVLLGRGGSDTSAAYIAAKIGAFRCEIWTDVPGIYTSNPRWVPAARLIKKVSFDEAREIALSGAKVLHPYCIDPLRVHRIPLHIRCTPHPEWEGTVITLDADSDSMEESTVKAISMKRGIKLISMETTDMWRKVGFLADVFTCFKKHGLSVDLIATAENNVTVSLDVVANVLSNEAINLLLNDLQVYCDARLINDCAVISLVGRNIRAILHQLAPMFSLFEEQKIYLLTQATTDINLTFVVDESQGERLLREMHAYLFEEMAASKNLGDSWQQNFSEKAVREEWWQKSRKQLLKIAEQESPVFVYDQNTLIHSARQLQSIAAVSRIFYAVKANDHAKVLNCFYEQGLGFECVSLGELNYIKKLFPEINPKRILFTPNFATKAEYAAALKDEIYINLDNLHPLEHWPELFVGREVFIRLDLGVGRGHHQFVKTAGKQSKFGIAISQLTRLHELVEKHQVQVIGLHSHAGSGVMEIQNWSETATILAEIASQFDQVTFLDIGGGLGVPEKPADKSLDFEQFSAALQLIKDQYPHYELWLEPGRYLVAEAGVLLAKVTQLKSKEEVNYIGLETGMNSLIRPMLYGAYHEIVNLTRFNEARTELAHIVGPICESGDVLGHARLMPLTQEGDVILIANAGAYGHTMSSYYNRREPAAEKVI